MATIQPQDQWIIDLLHQKYSLPAIYRASQDREQSRECVHATISFLHLTHNRSLFSIIRLHTVKCFPLKPPSFFKARLGPFAIPDPRRAKLHFLIWSQFEIFSKLTDFVRKLPRIPLWPLQFRLYNIFTNFRPNFGSNLRRSTGSWANPRLQCSSRPNEAWLPGGQGTSYSECLRKGVFLHSRSWGRKDETLWSEIRLEETWRTLPWDGQRVSMS